MLEILFQFLEISNQQDRFIYYIEYESGKRIRHKLDFNSPRTKEAAAQLGITFEDCVKKYFATYAIK